MTFHCGERPGDTGLYKWLILPACFSIQLVASGVVYSGDMFYVIFKQNLGGPSSVIYVATLLNLYLFNSIGPIAGGLTDRYGYRPVSLAGACTGTLGLILTAFAVESWELIITLGILSGLGFGVCFFSSIKPLVEYFVMTCPAAMSLAPVGFGAGPVIFPEIVHLSLKHFDYSNTLLIVAGVSMLAIIASLLLKEVTSSSVSQPEQEGREMVAMSKNAAIAGPSAPGPSSPSPSAPNLSAPGPSSVSPSAPNLSTPGPSSSDNRDHVPVDTGVPASRGFWTAVGIKQFLRIPLLQNAYFTCYLAHVLLYAFGISIVHAYVNNFNIIKTYNLRPQARHYIILGLAQTAAPPIYGVLTQVPRFSILRVYIASVLLCAGSCMAFDFFGELVPKWLTMILIGASFTPFISLAPLVTRELGGQENVAVGFGYVGVATGLGYVMGLPAAGWFISVMGNQDAMLLAGIFILSGALFLIPNFVYCNRKPFYEKLQ